MKKLFISVIIAAAMLSTIVFCNEGTGPNPPHGIAPIEYTISR